MAQTLQIKMSRNENSPWGFRLHGGVDFGTPLTIQKVSENSSKCLFVATIELYTGVSFSGRPDTETPQNEIRYRAILVIGPY